MKVDNMCRKVIHPLRLLHQEERQEWKKVKSNDGDDHFNETILHWPDCLKKVLADQKKSESKDLDS